jgi:hypothetical protein
MRLHARRDCDVTCRPIPLLAVFRVPSSMRGLLVVLGFGWSCAAPDSSGLFGHAPPNEPGSDTSSGEAAVNGNTGTAAGSDTEWVPPSLGGVQPTGTLPGTGVPPSSAPDAAAPVEPQTPTEQPGVPAEPAPTQPLPDAGPAEPQLPEPRPVCEGTLLQGSCWYLGDVSQACDDVCSTHGGFSAPSAAVIGTPAQGGSIEACTAILDALGALQAAVSEGYRDDDLGLGCHLYVEATGAEAAWWLTSPDLSPQASSPQTRQVCGCVR